MNSYKTLLGLANVDADVIEAEMISTVELKAENADINNAIINTLTIPNGADSYILTSDVNSLASWKPNILSGEVSGLASDTKLTIPNGQDGFILTSDVNSAPSWKFNQSQWIGNWNNETSYKRNNLVTHNHIMYRALFDNIGVVPNNEIGSYSLYNLAYPAPAHSTLAPDSLHQEIALRIEPNQRGHLTHFKFYNISLETVDIKIYQSPNWTIVHEQTSVVGLGWQTIELTSPVPVMARQSTLAAMRTDGQPYAYIPQDFDVILNADPAVYVGNDATSTETVFWYAKTGHPSSIGNPTMNGGVFNRVYLIDVVYEVGRNWEVVLDDRPDTVYETKAQSITNKINIETQDATVKNNLVLPNLYQINYEDYNLKYLVLTEDNYTRRITNLYAPTIGASNAFKFKFGAGANKVLSCIDDSGLTEWRDLVQVESVLMTGDVTGQSDANIINTLANGTINVNDLLTLADLPEDIVLESKAQPLRNKTDVDVVTLMVRESMKLDLPVLNSGVLKLRYLVGWNNPDFNDCKWVDDLYAPIISAQSQFLYPVNASAGKILSCVDATGLAQWITPPSQTMSGDVTGTSSATVVNTLAGGTINVNQLVTLSGSQFLQNKQLSALNTYFVSDTDPTRIIRYGLGPASPNTTLTIQSATTTNRTVIFPDANDTLVGKNTTDTLKNKVINDVSNNVYANGIRNGSTWPLACSGAAPAFNDVLCYKGAGAIWGNPTSMVTLAGDVTGAANNNVVNTLAGGTIPVNQLLTLNGEQVMTNKGLAGTIIFSDDTLTKTFRIMFGSTSANTTTMLIPTSTVSLRQIMLPDATDTLMGKDTTDIMKNKTLTDVSNTVYAKMEFAMDQRGLLPLLEPLLLLIKCSHTME